VAAELAFEIGCGVVAAINIDVIGVMENLFTFQASVEYVNGFIERLPRGLGWKHPIYGMVYKPAMIFNYFREYTVQELDAIRRSAYVDEESKYIQNVKRNVKIRSFHIKRGIFPI
jgi:hypothetical protein